MAKEQTYRQLREELDLVLSQLESPDVDVDDALGAYKRGVELVKQLEKHLKSVQNDIKIVNNKS